LGIIFSDPHKVPEFISWSFKTEYMTLKERTFFFINIREINKLKKDTQKQPWLQDGP
jgi:hypothetical protein